MSEKSEALGKALRSLFVLQSVAWRRQASRAARHLAHVGHPAGAPGAQE